ncbi:hypothetical protein PC110_g16945 [Phytophthora cactorum]|uniref:PiggyBac transposable element-derived protein domain-containing protein n=1 Tax=Phytophthora cactorum TaxID=29920 RepID=A0A329RR27_9STRA|nr:hypothetical protein PC110_g16945 [Phytophthora cactorum]
MGKDDAYLLANKQHAADTGRAVADKTVAGSGKKKLVQKKQVDNDLWSDDDGDEDYVEEDVVEEEDDEDEAIAEQAVAAKKPIPRKASATKTTVTRTKRVVTKPRKKSSRTLAKEAREASAAAKKVVAATRRQSEASASQRAGKEAKQAARKRLEEAGDKNSNGEKGSNKQKSAPCAMPNTTKKSARAPIMPWLQTIRIARCPSAIKMNRIQGTYNMMLSNMFTYSRGSQIAHYTRYGRPTSSESPICTANMTASQGRIPPSATQEAPSAITDLSASVEHDSSVPDWSLDSDCDEDDEELAFLDDVEIQADPRLPPEIPVLGDTNVDAAESDVVAVDPEDVQVEGKADCDWPVLSREKLLNFAKDEVALAKMRKSGWERVHQDKFPPDQNYPGLYKGPYGPSEDVMAIADSPLDLFLYFMPRPLWTKIAEESTVYHEQHLVERVDRMDAKQKVPGAKSKEEFMEREARNRDIKPHEIIVLLGLSIARMINPHRRHVYDHWSTTSIEAVAAGTFGKFMKRNRFTYIFFNLHFTNKADERVGRDRAWKVRSVVDVLQITFRDGYTTPPVISFDEAMIPLHNRHNPTR